MLSERLTNYSAMADKKLAELLQEGEGHLLAGLIKIGKQHGGLGA